ncbi:ABC transporter substrate-binding protein [Frankia sp. Ag45/Mut15]|uniref:ABC transporter substrate-binding protein n=1 Tax=Frankia umida TaxID=573489 RepID=A0ABT0K2V9_9ACTN|nr:ABC transporter substrate-binding protein [Frankia umida]MCK9878159.1 ABC transporter substrate-binding protein [Frankia umida]
MVKRSSGRQLGALAGVAAAVLALVAACGSSGDDKPAGPQASVSSSGDLLGPIARASGAPVQIGLISDGKSQVADNSIELTAAKATVAYLNERKSGIGGRPIKLVTCEAQADPAKAADCANQMIEDKVVAVIIGGSPVLASIWEPLHAAHVPTLVYSGVNDAMRSDRESTFTISDGNFGGIILPLQQAKSAGLKKVTYIVIDVPAALDGLKTTAPALLRKAGLDINVVAVPPGTADMTPQIQNLTSKDPGLVFILGNDSFCISALNGLRAVGYTGQVAAISSCVTDATRKAVPGSQLKGITISATVPIGQDNPATRLYNAVAKTYGSGIDTTRAIGMTAFTEVAAFQSALQGITGDITSQSVIKAFKGMPEREIPGSLGLGFRCNGKADPTAPSTCVRGGIVSTLDATGNPGAYKVVGATPIED